MNRLNRRKRKWQWYGIGLLCIHYLLSSFSVLALEKVKVIAYPIPLMIENNRTGLFIDLTDAVAQRAGLEVEILVVPNKRALVYFLQNKADVLLPGLDALFNHKTQPLRSEFIALKKDYIFTRKDSPLLTGIAQLEGKLVGITRGYPYTSRLLENRAIYFDLANSDERSARKLLLGRVDAFVAEETTGLQAFKLTQGQDLIQYEAKSPIAKLYAYYAFHPTAEGQKLQHKFSAALVAIKAEGVFNNIMRLAPGLDPD